MIFMSESNRTDIEQKIGSEVAQFVYKVPKENHDAMMQLNKHHEEIWGYTFSFTAK